ncbi:putative feruloyl esterase [Aspergillus fischeri NRRL 181]|uniref:Probable feruloyl esterase B-1 n=1 Tax=Neosartorya fischeri (strain ATCC 1020 / DSM 3700 / CBS 544.65 / FGSC A1164 / JCM 1740 / NRRL 181 / WB 181) TaxID=331117 RepID=FAEB1_NEOFI|nr:tannase and feruloyl esterase family protein [Aspergillus fischeri NRRL 181]A1DKV3.1 RecName: Full=Probable feruloyl esterase B-1; AltName: Full=Ferulic acid esterase B-1; Short=FAEB-1; Flags: Precursor [Aspergillus fischeri NRRL 181]EAW15424.1 tannase and feruloyl esterase family protein [Aspergillus fischeri NRRL 181]
MMRWFLLIGLASAAATDSSASFESRCQHFHKEIHLQNVHVHSTTYVPIGSNISMAYNPPICGGTSSSSISTIEFCQVALNVTTSDKSQFFMEAWLPSNYTGRFLSTGNGGLNGCVGYGDMIYASQYGFATIGTNNGHFGDTGQYFLNNPEVIEDFAYRALHTGTVVGKALTKLFYPQGYKNSYYLGCSTGGRQGWKSIQRFPDDFDGVVAGAPAFNFVNLCNWGSRFLKITGPPDSDTFVTSAQWSIIHNEIIRQCDALDGAVDGTIEDTDLCQPIFETLICNSTAVNKTSCLTGVQANTVNEVFSAMYGLDGKWLYPRMQPGSELAASFIYYSGNGFKYSDDWFKYVVYNDSNWDHSTWTLADAAAADAQDPFQISTFDGDISGFQKAGGKVLHYHGLEDAIITSDSSKAYYKHVADTMGLSPSDLDQFYRFFPISGMGHCSPGTGAASIGQGSSTYAGDDPQDNVLMAMVQWVEKGIAPEYVRGSKKSIDGQTEYRRKHCKYPKRNRYVGPGKYTDENAWKCV